MSQITIQPQENFAIVRQLADHTDGTTYYVRAVVRNSLDDTIIDTVNLTNQGSRRFTRSWQAPADVSGLGLYIDITTTVYSDSGYTTKSPNYGEENNVYLVYDRARHSGGGGSGGGADIDYKKIEKIVKSLADKITEKPKDTTKQAKPVDLKPVLAGLTRIQNLVAGIEMPEYECDFTPVLEAIAGTENKMLQAVDTITDEVAAIPGPEKVDFEPILSAIKELDTPKIEEASKKIIEAMDDMAKYVKGDTITEFNQNLATIKERIFEFLYYVNNTTKPKEVVPAEKPADRNIARAERLLRSI